MQKGEKGFISYIINTLNNIGMTHIWLEQFEYDENRQLNKPKIDKGLLKRFQDIAMQNILANVQNNNKLQFLNSIKDDYTIESYLKIKDYENRKAISKLRTSSHHLKIETGRWSNITRENRLCTQCSKNKIEDEYHFLFECSRHTTERKIAFETIKNITSINLSDDSKQTEKLRLLFKSDSISSLNTLGKFIKNSFSNRDET